MNFREQIQSEAEESLLAHTKASIDLAMRSGKTLVGLRVASKFKNVLVSYPNKPIKESWLGDSEKFAIDIQHVTFTTHVSLYKHDLSEYDCVILDEIDQVSIAGFEHISSNVPSRLYGMSGTMPTRGEKVYYIKRLAPIVYSKKLDETTGKTNKDYEIWVHLLKPSEVKNIPLSKGGAWSELAKIRFFDNKYQATKSFQFMISLMHAIAYSKTKYDYAIKLASKMKRGLLFFEKIEQCDSSGYPTYHSKNPDSEQNLALFQNEEIDILSTVGQLKAGVTFRNLEEEVIVHCYSSNNRTAQKIGRALMYIAGRKAIIHILVLVGTRDEKWASEALKEFDQTKIKYTHGN